MGIVCLQRRVTLPKILKNELSVVWESWEKEVQYASCGLRPSWTFRVTRL